MLVRRLIVLHNYIIVCKVLQFAISPATQVVFIVLIECLLLLYFTESEFCYRETTVIFILAVTVRRFKFLIFETICMIGQK